MQVWKRERERDISSMREMLKIITCGSVDDGKSTLIGNIFLDGLVAEREQGITIDVAYCFFNTKNRKFIVADTPGHEEYTRNMAVGAAFADLAIILIDAKKGLKIQTKRHLKICAMFGIKNFVFAVNKMDLVQYDEKAFRKIAGEIEKITSEYNIESSLVIPVSAKNGDNLIRKSEHTNWYKEGYLLEYLENINIKKNGRDEGFCMPVQRVCRPNQDFRGYQGTVEFGSIEIGSQIRILPSGEKANIKELYVCDKRTEKINSGQPVTIVLDRDVDISRGCVITKDSMFEIGSMFSAKVLCMDEKRLVEGGDYLIKIGTQKSSAVLMRIDYIENIENDEKRKTDSIKKNEIARCSFMLADKIVYTDFAREKTLGSFILIDRLSHHTAACGLIESDEENGRNIIESELRITKGIRSQLLNQKPVTVWFTGLSGAGKSTLANELEKQLVLLGKHTMILDGDNVRLGLNGNLGFSDSDRVENVRRIAEVAKLLNDAGIIVLVASISPKRISREMAKKIIGDGYIEVYVNAPLEVCENRDTKGLYSKSRKGEIKNFTGISSAYEEPINADIILNTTNMSVDNCVGVLMDNVLRKI